MIDFRRAPATQAGQIIIVAMTFSLVVLILVGSMISYALIQVSHQRQAMGRVQGLNIAEAGIERALWGLNNIAGFNGETDVNYGGGVYTSRLTNLSGSSKLITVEVYVPNAANPKAKRVVQVTANVGTTNVSFNYGVQVGIGGLEMNNSARVIGNVYSGGNIIGTNTARIQGTAIVATPNGVIDGMDIDDDSWSHTIRNGSTVGGNANHAVLQNTNVTGNVTADSISNCTIGGDATYDIRSGCNVSGSVTTPNPTPFTPAAPVDFPITQAQIDAWQQEAESGGTLGTQNYWTGSQTLGPKKINGDLILSNDARLTVTGTLWVTGQIRLTNTSIMRLSNSYGPLSGVVISGTQGHTTNGNIEISNSAQALGSGTAGSYIMLLSQRANLTTPAIRTSNSGISAILYAATGMVEINNTAALKEITAGKLRITNTASVTYETGLANANFSSGPGGAWEIQDQSWQLLQ